MPFASRLLYPKGFMMAAALLLGTASNPAQAQVKDLLSLYHLAKLRDPNYLAAHAQARADQEGEQQALGALLPNVSANAQLKQEDTTNTLRSGQKADGESSPKSYAITLNQALFKPQAWETYQQGQLSTELAQLSLAKAAQELIMRLSKTYFELLAAQDDLTSLLAQKNATAEQLEFAKRNFEAGNATITDQQEAQARYDLITAQELAARNTIDTRNLALESIVGEKVELLSFLREDVMLQPPQPENPEDWASKAQGNNLDLQHARLNQLIAKHEVKKAQYGHYPTVDFSAQLLNSEQQMLDSGTGQPFNVSADSKTLSLILNIPLYSGGAAYSKVRQQAWLLEKAGSQVELAERAATQEAKAAFLTVNSGLARVSALNTAVKSSELALKSNKKSYEVGVRINIDVLNAQQQLNATQRDLARAKYNALIGMLELKGATGELDEKSLEEINALLTAAP